MITWEFLLITYLISIYELNFNFTNNCLAYHKIMVYYIDFCENVAVFTFKLHQLFIFSLDPNFTIISID